MRHAMAIVDPTSPPSGWELGPAGRAAAADLARHADVGDVVAMASSPEPKAWATAAALAEKVGLDVRADDRLVEARRPWVGDGYRILAHRYLSGEEPPGWEARTEVAARVGAAVDALRADAGPGEVVVVGHGLSLTLHLEAVFGPPFDAYAFWCRLAFPDAWRVDRDQLSLSRVAR